MKFTHYIYISTILAVLSACSDDIATPTYTVGEANNAIMLCAGIGEGSISVDTRVTRASAEDNHASHVKFTSGTKAALRIDGTWTGHDPVSVSQLTTATIGDETSTDSKHNSITSMSPQRYWDDYGTADPANASTGRTTGLTIYGAAVNGVATAPTISSWTALQWNVGEVSNGTINQTSGWSTKDLLTSNNIKGEGRYTFANATATNVTNNLLEFTHAMTKVTVILTAGEGFADHKFVDQPSVTLLKFNYTGSVDIEAKTSTPTASTTTDIQALMNDGATWTSAATAQATAIVFPGNTFANTTDIIKINCDGNIYYVNATNINAANTETNKKFEQGKNYIFNITVNKTKIDVTATIKNWVDVTAADVSPVINVSASYGGTGTSLSKENFSFYRSTSMDNGYSEGYSGNANSYFAAESQVNKPSTGTTWTFDNPLYWSDHNTHYQMRGVWPLTSTETTATTSPRVETSTHESVDYQVIKVNNVPYSANSFPSDLAIARPNIATDAQCSNTETGHTKTNLYSGGICATEGTINLEFEYMMSQVEVNISTTSGSDQVRLTNAIVEVTNLYTAGEIKLGDREAFTTGSASPYTLHPTGTANQFKDAIVPQALTFSDAGASTNVRFKITITNDDAVLYVDVTEYNTAKGTSLTEQEFAALPQADIIKTPATQDIYYADVAPILKSGSTTDKVAPNGKWERGVHYVYNLKLSKTKIDVTALFKDWITVNANQDVWF